MIQPTIGNRVHISRVNGPDGRYELEVERIGGDNESLSADTLNLNGEHPFSVGEYSEIGSDPNCRIRVEIRDPDGRRLAIIHPE